MKPAKQFEAVVERQDPARNEVAQLTVVGHVVGEHEQCWQQAKRITPHPILTFREISNVTH